MKNLGRDIIFFTDPHCPFMHESVPDFLSDLKKKAKNPIVVSGGDEFDFHRISNHPSEPDSMGPLEEYRQGLKQVKQIYKIFPKVKSCISNHNSRIYRQAAQMNIPDIFLKEYREWMEAPAGWEFADKWLIHDILFLHGTCFSGKHAPRNAVDIKRCNVVFGHLHGVSGIAFSATEFDILFGATPGCLIDHERYAFRYGKDAKDKPVIGGLLIHEGRYPEIFLMDLGSKRVIRK